MLELPWYNDAHQQPPSPKADASTAKTKPESPKKKPADEQYRSALRGAVKNLRTKNGGFLKNPVLMPCGHVGDRYEAEYLYKQKQAFLKRANVAGRRAEEFRTQASAVRDDADTIKSLNEQADEHAGRKAQLVASAAKAYVCMRCPADTRLEIKQRPEQLQAEPRIGKFVTALGLHMPDGVDHASAEALELLKSELRDAKVRIPKMPDAQPNAEQDEAAYNCAVGESLAIDNKLGEAEVWFKAAVASDPEHPTYNRNMGVCLAKQNKKAEAQPYLLKAQVTQTNDPRQAERAALSLMAAGRFAEAETYFKAALSKEPLNSRLHSLVGTCAGGQGKHAEAYTHYNKALSMRPDTAKHQRDAGYSLYQMGRYAEAEQHLSRAHASEPKNARFAYELAWCNRKMGRTAAAEALFKEVLTLEPTNAHYNHDLGMYYFIQKKYFEARIYFGHAKKHAPDNAQFASSVDACDRKIDKKTTPLMSKVKSKFNKFMDDDFRF